MQETEKAGEWVETKRISNFKVDFYSRQYNYNNIVIYFLIIRKYSVMHNTLSCASSDSENKNNVKSIIRLNKYST